jgi:TonB family protein
VALSRVFLTSKDRFIEQVPDYWRGCVGAAVTGREDQKFSACRFSSEILAIPGMASSLIENSLTEGASAAVANKSYKVGYGVSAPRVISQRDPVFSEEADRDNFQGSVSLLLTVDKNGRPRNIQVVRPLGYGMDRQAVEAVSNWRFDPATKEGHPVDVLIAVEVDMHR